MVKEGYLMSRKSNKTLLFVGLAALAAGGAYYYYKKKVKDADFDDFDDFEDDDTELEDYLRESAYQSEQKERSIKDVFPINLSSQRCQPQPYVPMSDSGNDCCRSTAAGSQRHTDRRPHFRLHTGQG